jgi:uncharacterized protein YggE
MGDSTRIPGGAGKGAVAMRAAPWDGAEYGSGPSVTAATGYGVPPQYEHGAYVPADSAAGTTMSGATISVAGHGLTRRAPDLMRVVLAIEAVRERAAEAMAAAGVLADQVVAVARSAGIAAEDIRTSDISLAPDRVDGPYGGRVTGYRAGESFQLTVRRLYCAGPTLELVAQTCPSQVRLEAVAFGVTDQEELRGAARQAAYADAFTRAEHYARLAGRTLGPLQLLNEQELSPDATRLPAFPIGRAAAPTIPAVPTDLPSVQEQVTVQAVFAIR